MKTTLTYLALGDSMSIDFYTGVPGGGAVSQFYKRLCGRPGAFWRLDDRTEDGQRIADVDFRPDSRPDSDGTADLITMTMGGTTSCKTWTAIRRNSSPALARVTAVWRPASAGPTRSRS